MNILAPARFAFAVLSSAVLRLSVLPLKRHEHIVPSAMWRGVVLAQ